MTEIIYRPIKNTDNAALAQLIRAVFDEFDVERIGTVYSDASTDHLFELFDIDGAEYWVAEKSGEIIGGCGVFPTDGLDAGCAELVKLYLSPSHRNGGIGLNLLNLIIERSRILGYQSLYLESFNNFSKAVSIYQRLGFRHLSQPLGNSGHSACTVWMLKSLNDKH